MRQLIVISAIFFFFTQLACADDLTIRLASQPTESAIPIELRFVFDKPETIYNWRTRSTIYPMLGSGLNVECKLVGSDMSVPLRSSEKAMPVIPHKEDSITTTQYTETIRLVPSDHGKTLLDKGSYVISVTYNSADLMKYPGGKKLSRLSLKSNVIQLQIE